MRTTDEAAAVFCADQLAKCCYYIPKNLQNMENILDECAILPDALSMLLKRDERAFKAISTLQAHFITSVWRPTTGAATVKYNEIDMRLAWPIVKRHFHSILTNQGLGERLSRAESTEALQELRADAAKIAKK